MSNRGRQNVASALALDLGLDWRAGADWFETLLLDYDPASNWGNWAAAAGVLSSDQRVNRFNLVKQAKDYDPRGEYLRHWLPELANVPAPRIFEPWTMSRAEQEQYRCQIGVDYPAPPAARELAGRAAGAPAPRFGGGGRGGGGRGGGRGGGGGGGGGARDEGRGDGRGGGRGGERRRDAGPKGRRGDD
jgi:deoxyribodipyrimidine photo-lyase